MSDFLFFSSSGNNSLEPGFSLKSFLFFCVGFISSIPRSLTIETVSALPNSKDVRDAFVNNLLFIENHIITG